MDRGALSRLLRPLARPVPGKQLRPLSPPWQKPISLSLETS